MKVLCSGIGVQDVSAQPALGSGTADVPAPYPAAYPEAAAEGAVVVPVPVGVVKDGDVAGMPEPAGTVRAGITVACCTDNVEGVICSDVRGVCVTLLNVLASSI